MKEIKVKGYTRKSRSGKTIKVRSYVRRCEGCSKKGGDELQKNKSARENLISLYGKEGAKYIRQKFQYDGTSRYEDLAASKEADKDLLSEVAAYSERKRNYKGPKRVDVGNKAYFVSGDVVEDARGRKVGPRVSARVLGKTKKKERRHKNNYTSDGRYNGRNSINEFKARQDKIDR